MAKRTSADPTGQRINRARTARLLNQRLERARRDIVSLFRDIPKSRRTVKAVNADDQVIYDYDLTPEQVETLNNRIRAIIDEYLLETQTDTMPMRWWYQEQVEQPTRQATIEETNRFNRLILIAIGLGLLGRGGLTPQMIAPEAVLSSKRYLDALRKVYVDNFQIIKSLSDNTAAQVIRIINNGIQAGFAPADIAKNINSRFDVSQSNAERIARTEVNKAYNDAAIRATKTAEDISGLRSMVRHISALLPGRTRPHHAARHMNLYTPEAQEAWWNEGSNRINCYCSIEPVLIDTNGNIIEI